MKRVVIIFSLAAAMLLGAAPQPIENFSSPPGKNIKVVGNAKIRHDSKAGVLKMSFPKNDSRVVFILKSPMDLAGKPYIELKLRAVGNKKNQLFRIAMRKQDPGKSPQRFYTIVELKGDQFHTFRLDTRRQNYSYMGALGGNFRASGKQKDLTLRPGGKLLELWISPERKLCDGEVSYIGLLPASDVTAPVLDWSGKLKPASPVHKPYSFDKKGSKKFLIAEKGKSAFTINLKAAPSATERFAASELAKYLKQVTGADFKIVPGGKSVPAFVLRTDGVKAKFEEFTLKGDGRTITVSGNTERALLYGVYDFLEKACGVRFFGPFPEYTIVPRISKFELPEFEDHEKALMQIREVNYCGLHRLGLDETYVIADWAVKNRLTGEFNNLYNKRHAKRLGHGRAMKRVDEFYGKRGGVSRNIPGISGHNFHRLVPPSKYFKSHPEYFCYQRDTKKWVWERAQLCTTNPEVIKVIADEAERYFKLYPMADHLMLSPEDGSRRWCQCDNCSKLDPPQGYTPDCMADRLTYMANALRRELDRRGYKDKVLRTMAYAQSARRPFTQKPLPNIFYNYCITPVYGKKAEESAGSKNLAFWAHDLNAGINIHPYTYTSFNSRYQLDHTIVADYRFYTRLGITGNMAEYINPWDFNDYIKYLGCRVLWDCWFDEKEFKKDYFDKLYGPAGQTMIGYYEVFKSVFLNKENDHRYGRRDLPNFTPQVLQKLTSILRKAEKLARGNARVLKVLHRKKLHLELTRHYARSCDAAMAFQNTPNDETYKKLHSVVAAYCAYAKSMIKWHLTSTNRAESSIKMQFLHHAETYYKRHRTQSGLKKNYKIIATLPLEKWDFVTDKEVVGTQKKYFALKDYSKWKKINIGYWDNQGYRNFDGDAWYHLEYTMPVTTGKNTHCLFFEGIDESGWIYVNGKLIGSRAGNINLWKEPIFVTLPAGLKAGEKINLTVKVNDFARGGGIYLPVMLLQKK